MKLMPILLSACAACCLQAFSTVSLAGTHLDEFTGALTGGKTKLSARYRYEGVDDEANMRRQARASTLRTRLGYGSADFHGFSVYAEMEDIRRIGKKRYADGPGPADKYDTRYDLVPDPKETELNQAYLQFKHATASAAFLIRHGRQREKWDNDRFIGNVGWRQNEQTYDSTYIKAESEQYAVRAMYSRQTNVNRIFGDQAGTAGDFNVTNDNFNIRYSGLKYLDISAYYYLWESDEPATNAGGFGKDDSRKTAGIRLTGKLPVSDTLTLSATGEYASQDDYKDAASFSALDYALLEAAVSVTTGLENVAPVTLKAGFETLEGSISQGESFITPFATLHIFQGWADVFLLSGITGMYGGQAAGIEDLYFAISTSVYGTKLVAAYHRYEPEDSASKYDEYGSEINLAAIKKFAEHYTLGVKYADFDAKDGFRNNKDKSVFWLWGEINF